MDEALRFHNRSKTDHPDAPIGLLFADIGHPRAPLAGEFERGRAEDKEMGFQEVGKWFRYYLKDEGSRPAEGIRIRTQVCPYSQPSGGPHTAASWAALSPGELRAAGTKKQVINNTSGATADLIADGVASKFTTLKEGCSQTPIVSETSAVEVDFPVTPQGGFTLAGSPTVTADMGVSNGAESQVAARLLELKDGQQRLIARGVYRPDKSGRQVFQLHGNGYRFAPGMGKPGSLGGLAKKPLGKPVPNGRKLMKDYRGIGAVKMKGAADGARNSSARGKTLTLKATCKGASLCGPGKVTVKGKGKLRGVVARGNAPTLMQGASKKLTLKLTARARKAFRGTRKKKGLKNGNATVRVKGGGRTTSGKLKIKRTGRVR